MRVALIAAALGVVLVSSPLAASTDFTRITNKQDFVSKVVGKKLTRPLIQVRVTPRGEITGKGSRWAISGNWTWKDGYFCRTLNWGGDELGYNCQEVSIRGGKVRFRSDRGAGDFADFRIR